MTDQQAAPAKKPFWRRAVAGVLDFFTVFLIGGYVIGYLTGGITPEGFDLKGGPAFVLFAVVVLYFYLGWKRLGGTIWQRLLGAR